MDVMMIPALGILMPLVLVPTIIFMVHRQQRRKWEHLERLKAMETQLPIPLRQAMAVSGGVTAIGAGVPVVSVLGAIMTTLLWEPANFGDDAAAVPGIAWACAVLISAIAMGVSLKLASMQRQSAREAEHSMAMANGKAVYDPDAFDVVASRG